MTNGLSSPRAAEGPPAPKPDAARGAPPPGDAFAGILGDAQQARTATAEGQNPEKPEAGDDCATPAPAPADAAAADPAGAPATDPAVAAAAAVLAALPIPVVQPQAATPEAPAEQAATVVQGQPPALPAAGAGLPAVAAEIAMPAGTTPAVPAATAAEAVATVAAAAAVATASTDAPVQTPIAAQQIAPDAAKPVGQPVATPATAQPAVAATAQQSAAQQQQQSGQPQQQQPQPQQAPAPASQLQPQQSAPAAPAPPTVAPTAAPARPASPLPTPAATPVPLARAAEAVENVVRLVATRGGVTHARVALRPESLGSIDVHIRSTPDGLVARVVAHAPAAVQTLQQAAGDLRQSLEEQGLNFASLDIGQPGERRAGGRAHENGGGSPAADESVALDSDTTTTETLRLPTGVLVDVLA
jgi:flagellar hook-length control protein FliK